MLHKWDAFGRKRKLLNELDDVMKSLSGKERVMIGVDLNGHVGLCSRGNENDGEFQNQKG